MLTSILNWFLPHICVLCGSKSKSLNLDLCNACANDLPLLENYCVQCAKPLSVAPNAASNAASNEGGAAILLMCGACSRALPPYDKTISLFHYHAPVDYLLLELKFHYKLVYAKLLGALLAKYLKQYYLSCPKPEIIIPMPLHRSRLRERGYNQALEISRPIAKLLNIAIDKYSVMRIKNTKAQSLLSPKERKENVQRAFALVKPISYKHVAVIDDVITTGNTVKELCSVLRQEGKVEKIEVWSVARA